MNIELIEKRMKEKGYNPASLARAMGSSNPTLVRDILIGKSPNPTFKTLNLLSELLSINLSDIGGISSEKQLDNLIDQFEHNEMFTAQLEIAKKMLEKDGK